MLFKVLNEDGTCYNGGTGKWLLPHDGQPGDWMPAIEGELEPCENGYHLCRKTDLLDWLGPDIYEAECRGECIEADYKIVVREARLLRKLAWNERTARLFACDCAEYILYLYEAAYPNDARPRNAIEMARRYANNEATDQELTAAWADAWDATWAAARDAARAAILDASSIAARAAARAAALDTASIAARAALDAARAAALDAARASPADLDASSIAVRTTLDEFTKNLMTYLEEQTCQPSQN